MRYAKFWAAAIAAVLIAVQNAVPFSSTGHTWVSIILAAAGALAVYQVPNASPPPANADKTLMRSE